MQLARTLLRLSRYGCMDDFSWKELQPFPIMTPFGALKGSGGGDIQRIVEIFFC